MYAKDEVKCYTSAHITVYNHATMSFSARSMPKTKQQCISKLSHRSDYTNQPL